MKDLFILALLLFLFPVLVIARAKESDTIPAHKLEEVIIQDNRLQIPFSRLNRDVTVVDAGIIKTLPVQSVNEILGYVAGVDVRERGPWGAQADISINGGTFDQTLVLLNGFRLSDPQTGHNMMNLPVNPDAIERIEILKGAAASAYGINALNGAINIITSQPKENVVNVSLNAGTSFDRDTANGNLYGTLGVNISTGFASRNAQHYLSVGSIQSSGYRYNTPMNNNKGFYQNHIRLNDRANLKFMGGFVYNDFGANGFYSPPGDKNAREIVQTGIAGFRGDFEVKKGWNIRPAISYRYNHDEYVFIRKEPEVYRNNHFSHALEASVNQAIQTGRGMLGLGLEWRRESINSNSLGKHQRDNFGLYTEYELQQIGDLTINAGAYLNYSSHFGWQLLPSLDAGYKINSSLRFFANAGTGTRVPTYTDWYYKGPQNIGNSELTPEYAFHSEAGLKFSNPKIQATATYFYRYTTDFIDWVKFNLDDPWQPRNFQKIKVPGVSIQADYRLLGGQSPNDLRLIAGLSYSRLDPKISKPAKEESGYSQYALENLKNQLIVRMNTGMNNWNATIAGRYQQRVNYKDYVLMDAKFEMVFGNITGKISLNNLLNITYVEAGALPLPGRWLSAGVQWSFGKAATAQKD